MIGSISHIEDSILILEEEKKELELMLNSMCNKLIANGGKMPDNICLWYKNYNKGRIRGLNSNCVIYDDFQDVADVLELKRD